MSNLKPNLFITSEGITSFMNSEGNTDMYDKIRLSPKHSPKATRKEKKPCVESEPRNTTKEQDHVDRKHTPGWLARINNQGAGDKLTFYQQTPKRPPYKHTTYIAR